MVFIPESEQEKWADDLPSEGPMSVSWADEAAAVPMEMISGANLPDILVDNREPEDLRLRVATVLGKAGATTKTDENQITDYIIPAGPWAIERKAVGDFIGTVLGGERWGDQMQNLKMLQECGYKVALLLEGDVNKELRHRRLNALSLTNLINSVVVKWGVYLLYVPQEWQTEYVIRYLWESSTGKKVDLPPRKAAKRTIPVAEQAAYVVAGFPGIGPASVASIRKNTESLESFLKQARANSGLHYLNETKRRKLLEIMEANWKNAR